MISSNQHPHSAFYDEEGNIIIPPSEPAQHFERKEGVQPEVKRAPEPVRPVIVPAEVLNTMKRDLSGMMESLMSESASQARASVSGGKQFARALGRGTGASLFILREFLLQPVWVPTRGNKVKQYSRGTLFVLDIFRFGTTFASIFLLLFVTLNYQSFWEILESNLNPISIADGSNNVDGALREKLKKVPGLSTAGAADGARIGDLLSFLPEVGPPDDRIIIPKLNLNIPLIAPSYGALLKEDWPQVEKDIQGALEQGVVHYPGTARPGQAGNFFVTGHSSYYPWAAGKYKTIFARLHQLNVGDEYWVYYGGDKHRYTVIEKKEVSPSDISVLDQPTDLRLATLMTCTPVGTTLRRLIIVSQEIDPLSGVALAVGEKGERSKTASVPLEALPI